MKKNCSHFSIWVNITRLQILISYPFPCRAVNEPNSLRARLGSLTLNSNSIRLVNELSSNSTKLGSNRLVYSPIPVHRSQTKLMRWRKKKEEKKRQMMRNYWRQQTGRGNRIFHAVQSVTRWSMSDGNEFTFHVLLAFWATAIKFYNSGVRVSL